MSSSSTTAALSVFPEWTYAEVWERQRTTGNSNPTAMQQVDTSQCIQALIWSHEESLLWACTREGVACVWRVPPPMSSSRTSTTTYEHKTREGGAPYRAPFWRHRFTPKETTLRDLTLSPGEQQLIVAGTNGVWVLDTNRVWKHPQTAEPNVLHVNDLLRLPTHPNAWTSPTVTETGFIGDPATVMGVAENDDFGIYQWDMATQRIVNTISPSARGIRITSISTDNSSKSMICAAGDSQGVIRLWDIANSSLIATLPPEQTVPVRFVRNVSKEWLVAAYEHNAVTTHLVTWHLGTQSIVARTIVPAKIQTMVVMDNDKLWVGSNDGQVHVFTALDLGLEQRSTVSTTPSVHAIAVSTSRIAVAGVGATVEIWDTDCLPFQRLTL